MSYEAVVVGGVGYLGYNLVEKLVREGWNTLVVTRLRSIAKRRWLFRKILMLDVDIEVFKGEIYSDVDRLKRLLTGCHRLYNLIGINRGSWRDYHKAHILIPTLLLKTYLKTGGGGTYIHISAYMPQENPFIDGASPAIQTNYLTSKYLGEEMLRRACGQRCRVIVLRPGLIIGKYPYHREWIDMYRLAKHGVTLSIGLKSAAVDTHNLWRAMEYLIENSNGYSVYNVTPYHIDIGLINRVFHSLMGSRERIHIHIRPPQSMYKFIPSIGELDFIRGFASGHTPPYPTKLVMRGFKFENRLIQSLKESYNSLTEILEDKILT